MLILSCEELTLQNTVNVLLQHVKAEADRNYEAYYGRNVATTLQRDSARTATKCHFGNGYNHPFTLCTGNFVVSCNSLHGIFNLERRMVQTEASMVTYCHSLTGTQHVLKREGYRH